MTSDDCQTRTQTKRKRKGLLKNSITLIHRLIVIMRDDFISNGRAISGATSHEWRNFENDTAPLIYNRVVQGVLRSPVWIGTPCTGVVSTVNVRHHVLSQDIHFFGNTPLHLSESVIRHHWPLYITQLTPYSGARFHTFNSHRYRHTNEEIRTIRYRCDPTGICTLCK